MPLADQSKLLVFCNYEYSPCTAWWGQNRFVTLSLKSKQHIHTEWYEAPGPTKKSERSASSPYDPAARPFGSLKVSIAIIRSGRQFLRSRLIPLPPAAHCEWAPNGL